MAVLGQVRESIRTLREKQDALENELDRSLALQGLWPTVFDSGAARSQWVITGGGPRGLVRKKLEAWDNLAILWVYNGEGRKRSFRPSQVPYILLHADIQEAVE